MGMVARRFDVFLVQLDPTVGAGIQKQRPCVIVSPDEMNRNIRTVIIAPMTTKGREYPTRVPVRFQGKAGQIVLDQLRTIDHQRLVKKIGKVSETTGRQVLDILAEIFAA